MLRFKEWLVETEWVTIGHLSPDDYLWVWSKGKLIAKKNGVDGSMAMHGWYFQHGSYSWKGRFDAKTKKVSVTNENLRLSNRIPHKLKQALKQEFGNDIVFRGFGVRL